MYGYDFTKFSWCVVIDCMTVSLWNPEQNTSSYRVQFCHIDNAIYASNTAVYPRHLELHRISSLSASTTKDAKNRESGSCNILHHECSPEIRLCVLPINLSRRWIKRLTYNRDWEGLWVSELKQEHNRWWIKTKLDNDCPTITSTTWNLDYGIRFPW